MLFILPIALIAIVANKVNDSWKENRKGQCRNNKNGVFYVRHEARAGGLGPIDELYSPQDFQLCKEKSLEWKEVYRNNN